MKKNGSGNAKFQKIIEKRDKRLQEVEKEFKDTFDYLKFAEEEEKLYKKLTGGLPEELKEVFGKYNGTINYIMVLQSEFYYDNGYKDLAEFILENREDNKKTKAFRVE